MFLSKSKSFTVIFSYFIGISQLWSIYKQLYCAAEVLPSHEFDLSYPMSENQMTTTQSDDWWAEVACVVFPVPLRGPTVSSLQRTGRGLCWIRTGTGGILTESPGCICSHSCFCICPGFGWDVWELQISWTWIATLPYVLILCADTYFKF